ncbi:myb/SANT-like DNA-binding domain-containing protein 3 isoform X1 [Palaemon carinicauda]|uniref:myb/SANT-like DNA-binding domain-containing protein 3 isoform X1 n=1 Tax=Palaemon carinicauda TaxID=392227 RepID=UPI0035B5B35F
MAGPPDPNGISRDEKTLLVLNAGPGRKMFTEEDKTILGIATTPARRIFTEEERQLLIHLLKDYPLLESKSSDTATLQKKWRFWVELTNRFNAAHMNTKRTPEQLRKCWKNMKSKARKNYLEAGDQLNSHATYLENHASPTLVNVEVDPALIDPSPEPVQDAWEGDHTAKNGNDKVQIQISKPEAVTVKSPPNQQPSKPQSSAAASRVPPENNAASVKLETAASSDSVWPVSLRPYQKRKLDSILEQDQKLINSQLTLSKIEEEKNLLQLKILNGQLKNVQKEADLLDKKILLTDRKIQYWDRLLKNGSGHHVFPNV